MHELIRVVSMHAYCHVAIRLCPCGRYSAKQIVAERGATGSCTGKCFGIVAAVTLNDKLRSRARLRMLRCDAGDPMCWQPQ